MGNARAKGHTHDERRHAAIAAGRDRVPTEAAVVLPNGDVIREGNPGALRRVIREHRSRGIHLERRRVPVIQIR